VRSVPRVDAAGCRVDVVVSEPVLSCFKSRRSCNADVRRQDMVVIVHNHDLTDELCPRPRTRGSCISRRPSKHHLLGSCGEICTQLQPHGSCDEMCAQLRRNMHPPLVGHRPRPFTTKTCRARLAPIVTDTCNRKPTGIGHFGTESSKSRLQRAPNHEVNAVVPSQ